MANDQQEDKASRSTTWPYTSFKTFLNVLTRFRNAIPPQIDRSALGGSEGQKTQVLGALKFLGLIEDSGKVTPVFVELVNAVDKDRPALVKGLLERYYAKAIELGRVNGTTAQLQATFQGVTGETQRKAMTFYLHAAKYAQIQVSRNFKIPSGFTRSRKAGKANHEREHVDEPPATPSPQADFKAKYLDMLMEKAKSADGALDEGLLDRIERLLGYADAEESTDAE